MGVYIPTMIMPSDCDYCDLYQRGYCCAKGARVQCEEGVDADCPLVEVKAPHGRLVSASTLMRMAKQELSENTVGDIQWLLGHAPTVIEAEVE